MSDMKVNYKEAEKNLKKAVKKHTHSIRQIEYWNRKLILKLQEKVEQDNKNFENLNELKKLYYWIKQSKTLEQNVRTLHNLKEEIKGLIQTIQPNFPFD